MFRDDDRKVNIHVPRTSFGTYISMFFLCNLSFSIYFLTVSAAGLFPTALVEFWVLYKLTWYLMYSLVLTKYKKRKFHTTVNLLSGKTDVHPDLIKVSQSGSNVFQV